MSTSPRYFRQLLSGRDFAVGDQMAMPAGNVSNFRPDEEGMAATYAGLDRTVREWRGKERHERRRDADQFWGDRKEAEEL